MAKYKLTQEALSDLGDIWNYTFDVWSEQQADRYYQRLIRTFGDIAKGPLQGKDYCHILPDVFGRRVGRHIVFYRIRSEAQVEIVRILHERMDLEHRLTE